MGRSKFPGKPSKLSSKKRVSVLVSTSPPSSAVSPAVSSASASSPRGGGKSPQIIGINEDTAINNNLSGTSNNITAAAELEQQINSGVRRDDDQINCNGGDGGKNNKNHVALSGGSAVIKLCACHDYLGGGGDRKSDVLLLSSTSSSSKSKVCAKCNLPSRNNGCTTQQLPNGTDNVMSSRNIRDGDQHQVTTIKIWIRSLCNNWWKCRARLKAIKARIFAYTSFGGQSLPLESQSINSL